MASCNAVMANALAGSLSPAFIGNASSKVRSSARPHFRPAFGGARCAQIRAAHACSSEEDRGAEERQVVKEGPPRSLHRSLAAAALAGLLTVGQVPSALAEKYDFNTSDEQSLTQSVRPEAGGKANTRDAGLLREGRNSPDGANTGKSNIFDFNTSDEQTLTQNRQGEGSGKASSRQPGAGRSGPTAGITQGTSSDAGVNLNSTIAAAFDFNTSDEQTLTQKRQGEGSGKANSRDDLAREGPTSGANRASSSANKASTNNFDFNTSDEQTLTQKRQGEGSGKANSRDDLAREGPTAGVKRASSSQAPSEDDFPGRAGRIASKAKDTAENLVPGQPGKALENATRGLRFGKDISDAGLNPVTTVSAAFDFNTSDEQTLTQKRQGEGSGKANSRDDLAREGPTSGANRASSSANKASTNNFDFNTSDEQTLTQKRQGEGSGKANSRDDLAREGPTAGVKRASSSQAPSEDDFPGRAGRIASKAKDTAENLVPGQPGKALENATRGLRFGKDVSDAGLNPVTTVADISEGFVNPREGLADARESVQSNRLEARRVSKEAREGIMKDNAEKAATSDPPKTVQELVAEKQKLVGKVESLQDGMDSAAPGQAGGKSFY